MVKQHFFPSNGDWLMARQSLYFKANESDIILNCFFGKIFERIEGVIHIDGAGLLQTYPGNRRCFKENFKEGKKRRDLVY